MGVGERHNGRVTDGAPAELTMLFTDIEGSTRLLNQLGAGYADVLSAHRRILRAAFGRWGGRELGTEGDSFFVVFGTAQAGVAAAADGQLGLERHSWPRGVGLRVRVGLHTGRAQELDGDLVGFDVHLAARISATAHGGQIVMSASTADEAADLLPEGTQVVRLGVHRLKDIPELQRLCQLVVPGLPSSFAPLRSLGAPGSLPVSHTPFLGRAADLAAVTSLVRGGGARLVTLTGPGGTGKTRLALAAAAELSGDFADGVHFVDLATATDDAVAWTTVGEALGRSGEAAVDLVAHLQEQSVLLVLDNLEQLPASGRAVVSALLEGAELVRLLATSRAPLHVTGEQVYPVPPLGLPVARAGPVTVREAESSDAVRMFVQLAAMSEPAFRLTEDNVTDVVSLCRRLDGLPLALELAAARIRLLPPRALLEHVDEALGLPLSGHTGRQRSLVATVTWSYGMVDPQEQRVFRALSVFGASGCTFDALAAVLEVPSVLGPVAGLLDAALVRVDDDAAGPRLSALQTVRSVARALVREEGELELLQERHARHYVAMAERTAPRLKGPHAVATRAALEQEMDNLRAALDWSLDAGAAGPRGEQDAEESPGGDRAELGMRLCAALGWYWYLTGYDTESRRWLERASRAAASGQGPQLARLLHSFGLLQLQQGDLTRARDVMAKSLVLWRRAGDRTEESVVLNSLGVIYRALGQPDRARRLLRDSIEVARGLGNLPRQATALTNLALLEIDTGRADEAITLLREAERIDAGLEDAWGVAADRSNLAAALLTAGRVAEAVDLLCDLAAEVEDHGDPDLSLAVVELVAVAASQSGQHERAVRLAASAAQHRAGTGFASPEPDIAFLESRLASSRRSVGSHLERLEGEGRALDLPGALAQAAEVRAGEDGSG